MKTFKYKNYKVDLFQRRFKNKWHLNFVPIYGAVDICSDSDYDHIIGRCYDLLFLTIGIRVYIPQNRYYLKKMKIFP